MNNRDERYILVKPMISSGMIITLSDIFKILPKSTLAAHIGKRTPRFTELMKSPLKLTFEEAKMMGGYFDLDLDTSISLVVKEYYKTLEEKNK